MAIAAAAIGVIGAVGGIIAQRQASEAQQKLYWQQARAEMLAAHAAEDSAVLADRQARRRSQLLLGKQRAIGAAAGVDISSGSPLALELDNVHEAEIEALSIRRVGTLQAMTLKYAANLYKY